jgi:hypothetical protein
VTDERHHLPEDPDPNEVAGDFGVDPHRERAGDTGAQRHEEQGSGAEPGGGAERGSGTRRGSDPAR